jgi:hypothetical protein
MASYLWSCSFSNPLRVFYLVCSLQPIITSSINQDLESQTVLFSRRILPGPLLVLDRLGGSPISCFSRPSFSVPFFVLRALHSRIRSFRCFCVGSDSCLACNDQCEVLLCMLLACACFRERLYLRRCRPCGKDGFMFLPPTFLQFLPYFLVLGA